MTVIVPGKPIPPIVVEPTVDGPVTVQVGRPGPVGPAGPAGAGLSDGDRGDITVSASGTAWTIDAGAVTDAKIAAVAWGKLTGIPAPISGTTAAFTTAQETKLAGIATGATANATDAFLLARANHTGTQAAGTITGLAAVATSGSASDLGAGTLPNARLAAFGSGDVSFAAGGGAGTIAADAVTNTKLANMAANSLKGNNTGSAADPLDLTVAQVKTLLAYTPADIGAATSAQANATHTGDATGATALTLATVNSNVGAFGSATQVATFTVNGKGLTTAAANVAISIPATAISDSTAAGRSMVTAATATAQTALLDAFTSGAKGLAPASGGGTTNFLRADGTWAAAGGGSPVTVQDEGSNITTALGTLNFVGAGVTVTGGATATVTIPGGGGGGLSDGNYGEVTVSGTGTVIRVNPKVKFGLPLAMARRLFF